MLVQAGGTRPLIEEAKEKSMDWGSSFVRWSGLTVRPRCKRSATSPGHDDDP